MNIAVPILISLITLLYGKGEVDLLFAGDAMQHQGQLDAARCSDGSYNYDECFSEIAPYIQAADYAVVNLETPLGGKSYSGYPCFNSPDSYAVALKDAGFDMMLTANNHTLDRLDRGAHRTITVLDSLGVDHLGTYHDSKARSEALPLVKMIHGFNIGFLNYTYGTNGIAVKGNLVVDYINRDKIKTDIAKLRDAKAEIIVTMVHWGEEYKLIQNSSQKSLADFLVDQGVDLIIGSHPHVIQPMEVRYSEKYDKDVLIVYSLGNFISNMKTRDTRGGAIVNAKLVRDERGRAKFSTAKYRLVFTIPGKNPKNNYRLVFADECDDSQWRGACNLFKTSAESIFKKHNVKVDADYVAQEE